MGKKVIERIEELITAYSLSYNAFDEKVGFTNGYIGRNIRSKASLGADKVQQIYCAFEEVSGDWILGAEVPMLKKDNIISEENKMEDFDNLNDFEKSLISLLRKDEFKIVISQLVNHALTQK